MASALCEAELGGTPRSSPSYEASRDLNGDGRTTSSPISPGSNAPAPGSAFCGPSGCPVQRLAVRAGARLRPLRPRAAARLLDRGRRGRRPARARRPLRRGLLRAVAATADCTRTWRFSSNAPENPPDRRAGARRAARRRSRRRSPPPTPRRRRSPAGRSGGCRARARSRSAPGRASSPRSRPSASRGSPSSRSPSTTGPRPRACSSASPSATVRSPSPPASRALPAAPTSWRSPTAPLPPGSPAATARSTIKVDGQRQGMLSLAGSTKALRGALADCLEF